MGKKEMTFEEAMEALEKCAEKLRDEEVPLEEAIRSFEEGLVYYKKCTEILTSAKQKIETYKD